MFKEIALQVSKGKSSLNFPRAQRHLLLVASSHLHLAKYSHQDRQNCQIHQAFHQQVGL